MTSVNWTLGFGFLSKEVTSTMFSDFLFMQYCVETLGVFMFFLINGERKEKKFFIFI